MIYQPLSGMNSSALSGIHSIFIVYSGERSLFDVDNTKIGCASKVLIHRRI